MNRRNELEDKIAEFEIERENRLANMGESRRSEGIEEEKTHKSIPNLSNLTNFTTNNRI